MKVILTVTVLIVIIMIGLNITRSIDEFRSYLVRQKLEHAPKPPLAFFSKDLVQDLPEPAKRYFEYSIQEGAALKQTIQITMAGQIGLGAKSDPDYMDMTADQIMHFPQGFVWIVKTGRGPMVVTGSDGFFEDTSWSRFWLMHALPIGRAGGLSKQREDHRRAAFGRLVAEAAFWSPAALLPSDNVVWEAVDTRTARATIFYEDLLQTVDIEVDETGQPRRVTIPRWSDSNPENTYQLQPFGGYLSAFKTFDGYRLPTHVEGGNFIGTEKYFPFYIADIKTIEFLDTTSNSKKSF